MSSLQVTLDGIRTTHDKSKGIPCFDRVIENIVENADKTRISVRVNVSSKNKDEIAELVDWLMVDKGLDGKIRVYLARVDDLDSCESVGERCLDNFSFVDFRNDFIQGAIKKYNSFAIDDLLPEIKRNYCGYEKVPQIMIGPDGELYRCQRTMGNRKNAIGDIYAGSFFSTSELSLIRPLDDSCLSNCNLLPICFGGCPNERRKGKALTYCLLKKMQIEKDLFTYVTAKLNG